MTQALRHPQESIQTNLFFEQTATGRIRKGLSASMASATPPPVTACSLRQPPGKAARKSYIDSNK
jgi:hypothetical protein